MIFVELCILSNKDCYMSCYIFVEAKRAFKKFLRDTKCLEGPIEYKTLIEYIFLKITSDVF